MMGRQRRDQGRLFYEFRLEDRIPENHLLRRMNVFVTVALADLHKELEPHYSDIGRPSIDPELMIRMLIVGYCYGIRSERKLTQEVELHLAYRWFCKLDLDDKVPHKTRRSPRIAWAVSARAICCATSSSAWCGRRWRWAWSRAKALPSTPACWRPTPAAITARRPMSSIGPTSSVRHERWPSILLRSMRPPSPIQIARRRRSSRRPIPPPPGRPRPTSACSSATGSTI